MLGVLIALLATQTVYGQFWNQTSLISIRDEINKKNGGWVAAISPGIPYGDLQKQKALLGAKFDLELLKSQENKEEAKKLEAQSQKRRLQTIPASFNLTAKFPTCWSIGYIRSQASCGSCWAVASAASLSDRFCVVSGGLKKRSFSYEDMLECCSLADCGSGPGFGCDGGYIQGGFVFGQKSGIVTGENYQNFTTCKPYFLSPSASYTPVSPACSTKCANSLVYTKSYASDKVFTKGYAYITGTTYANIVTKAQQAIMLRGSIVAGMTVYEDFYYYKTGIYRFVWGKNLGGHAVRVIGWGVEGTAPYWIVANSWGTSWGLKGFFWIKRGVNECGIESWMTEGLL